MTPYPFKLEFSEDDLSVDNASCARVDITDLLQDDTLSCKVGIERPGDPPKAGEMSFTLRGRDFEPLNADSPYSPNVQRRRRFFLSFLRGATWQQAFVGYARSYQPVWPGNSTVQLVDVICGDGHDVLANSRQPALNPPTAMSYDDVVIFDAPFGAYAMSESSGAKMEPLTGPEGVYGRLPTHGRPGLVVGDRSTAMLFQTQDQYARVPLGGDELLIDGNQIALEVIHEPTTIIAGVRALMVGPLSATQEPYTLVINASGQYEFRVRNAAGTIVADPIATTLPQVGTERHIVGEWDGHTARIIIDGVVEDEDSASVTVSITTAIACYIGSPNNNSAPGVYQKAAFYEHALGATRAAAHAQAAFERGFEQQTAGERIAEAATHSLWDTSGIDTSGLDVIPVMKVGQSPLALIDEAAKAEGLRPLFFVDGDGNPQYRSWEWQSAPPYNEAQATFGAPADRAAGELYHDESALVFDDEFYTDVTHARVDGLAHTESLAGIPDEERAAAEPITDLILVYDSDVMKLCREKLDIYGDARYIVEEINLHGGDDEEQELIFDLGIGSRIRFKRRVLEDDDTLSLAHDIVTHIIGYELTLGEAGIVTCKWKLARGIDMTAGLWRLGLVGASELDTTASPA